MNFHVKLAFEPVVKFCRWLRVTNWKGHRVLEANHGEVNCPRVAVSAKCPLRSPIYLDLDSVARLFAAHFILGPIAIRNNG